MRILATGHNGYIGSVLTELLLDVATEVAEIDSGFFKARPTEGAIDEELRWVL